MEILNAIWEVMSYQHHGGGATLSFLPWVAAAIGAINAVSGEASRYANKKARAVATRWAPYGTKAPEKEQGNIAKDFASGASKTLSLGSAMGMGGGTPTMTPEQAAKDIGMAGVEEAATAAAKPGSLYSVFGKEFVKPKGVATLGQSQPAAPQPIPQQGQPAPAVVGSGGSKWEAVGGQQPIAGIDPRLMNRRSFY